MPILPDELDADPWLFTVGNGTLDLRTGRLQSHRHEDHITKLSKVGYDTNAQCPIFEKFIGRIMQDATGNPRPDLVRFLKKAIGYAVTGMTSEQCLFMLHGLGANGKTTLLNVLLEISGDYGKQADPDLLLAKDGAEHPTGQADLFGCRLVVCTETNEGRRFDEARLKRLTGEDRIKARFIRQDFFEFTSTHKIFLACNHKPSVRGTDHAFWRRIRLIPFETTIPQHERDKLLPTKLRGEASGILAWCVEGCLLWQREGLDPPIEVVNATDEYRGESDTFGQFVETCCVMKPTAWTPSTHLRTAHEAFCSENAVFQLNGSAYTQRLKQLGCSTCRESGKRGWRGIDLAPSVDSQDSSDTNSGITPMKGD